MFSMKLQKSTRDTIDLTKCDQPGFNSRKGNKNGKALKSHLINLLLTKVADVTEGRKK